MSDENVGGLVIQWRHNAQGCGRGDAQAAATWRSCARQLEAALSAHGQPVVDDGSKTCAEILLATELSGDFPYAAEAIMQGKWEYIDSRAAIRAISAALTGATP